MRLIYLFELIVEQNLYKLLKTFDFPFQVKVYALYLFNFSANIITRL